MVTKSRNAPNDVSEDNAMSRVATATAVGAVIALAYYIVEPYFVAPPIAAATITKKTHLVLVDSRLWEKSHEEIKKQAKPGVIVKYVGGPGDIPIFLSTLTQTEKDEIASISMLFHGSPSDAQGTPITGAELSAMPKTVSTIEILRAEISLRDDDLEGMLVTDPTKLAESARNFPRFWELRTAMGQLYAATMKQKAPFFLYACNLASIDGFKKLFLNYGREIYASTDVTGSSKDTETTTKNWRVEWCSGCADGTTPSGAVADHATVNLFGDPDMLPLTLGTFDIAANELRAEKGEVATRPAALAVALDGATYAYPDADALVIDDVLRSSSLLNTGPYALLAIYIAGEALFGREDHDVLNACNAYGIPVVVCGLASEAAAALVKKTADTRFYVPVDGAAKQIIAAIDFDGRFCPSKRLAIVLFGLESRSVDVLVLDALQHGVGDLRAQALHAALASAPLLRSSKAGRPMPVEFDDIATRRAAQIDAKLVTDRETLEGAIRTALEEDALEEEEDQIDQTGSRKKQLFASHSASRKPFKQRRVTDAMVNNAGAAAIASDNSPVGLRQIAVYVGASNRDLVVNNDLENLYTNDADADSFDVVFVNGDDVSGEKYFVDLDHTHHPAKSPWPWVDYTRIEGRESIRVLRGVIDALVGPCEESLVLLDVPDKVPAYGLCILMADNGPDVSALGTKVSSFQERCVEKKIKRTRKKRIDELVGPEI
jgi:hypothetical protein